MEKGALKTAIPALLLMAGGALCAAVNTAERQSWIRVSGRAVTESKQFAEVVTLTPEGVPWVGEAINELEAACGVTLAQAAPEAMVVLDLDEPDYSYAIVRFGREMKSAAQNAVAKHPELFGAEGENTFVLKRWSGKDGKLTVIFVEPELAVVGMEFTARSQAEGSAGYRMPKLPSGKAVAFELALPDKSHPLLCGVKKVTGSLELSADGVRVGSVWTGGDLRRMQGVIQGLYGVGVVLCFAGDQQLMDAARSCLRVKRQADLRADVFIPDNLWGRAVEALRRKLADDSLTLIFDDEEEW